MKSQAETVLASIEAGAWHQGVERAATRRLVSACRNCLNGNPRGGDRKRVRAAYNRMIDESETALRAPFNRDHMYAVTGSTLSIDVMGAYLDHERDEMARITGIDANKLASAFASVRFDVDVEFVAKQLDVPEPFDPPAQRVQGFPTSGAPPRPHKRGAK